MMPYLQVLAAIAFAITALAGSLLIAIFACSRMFRWLFAGTRFKDAAPDVGGAIGAILWMATIFAAVAGSL